MTEQTGPTIDPQRTHDAALRISNAMSVLTNELNFALKDPTVCPATVSSVFGGYMHNLIENVLPAEKGVDDQPVQS